MGCKILTFENDNHLRRGDQFQSSTTKVGGGIMFQMTCQLAQKGIQLAQVVLYFFVGGVVGGANDTMLLCVLVR